LPEEFTYASAGVNRKLRAKSKEKLDVLKQTYGFAEGKILQLPYGNIIPDGKGSYLDLQIEGVGTKVLIAQLAKKYDTIGIDSVAMTVNDIIRSVAKPFALADNIHTKVSDPLLLNELLKGITEGAKQSECTVPSGETGDVPDIINGLTDEEGFDIIVAAIGEVAEHKIIRGTDIEPNDPIIGFRSSGLHSNGISLARRILFRQWGGKYEPEDVAEGLSREIVLETLEPTRIYVKPFLKLAEQIHFKAAVHITGDAYLKFDRLTKYSKGIGFAFENFRPQPIFDLIQKTARELGGKITDEEMFRTFNMGWGFAIITDTAEEDDALAILNKAGTQAERIGRVTSTEGIRIVFNKKKLRF
jgi:phosphoribosylformylglycinamidine cyclo-ligase